MRTVWIKLIVCLASAAGSACAEEGKWTPQQVLQLDPQWLAAQGLELPVSRLWDPVRGTGLLSGAVNIGGCSAGFVSANGLILTNHHCLFGVVQEHSRPGRDLIANGFLARTPEEELRGSTTRVTVPRKFTDVTAEIHAATPAGADALAVSKAIEAKQNALVAECEKSPGSRCRVAAFDGGLQYVLVDTFELTDIRLVYAPPRAVGEYGGEEDNFRWPRHVGDFAIARAYKDGKPYQPEFYFPISQKGVKPGDFVMVLGYPGRTMRSLTAREMAYQRDWVFKMREELYGAWIRILEDASKTSAEAAIAVASTLKSLNNSHTNAMGQLAGLKRGQIIENQAKQDDKVASWVGSRPEFARALAAKAGLDRMAEERSASGARDFLFQAMQSGPLGLRHAVTLVRLAAERAKPDAERESEYMERVLPQLRATLENDQKSYFRPTDEAETVAYLERALALDPGHRIRAVDSIFKDKSRLKDAVHATYEGTKVTDADERLKMFTEPLGELRARKDPLLELAFSLEPEMAEWRAATKTYDGRAALLRPEWRKAVIAHAGKPVAPDANSTLRVSFAHVEGYSPRDGVNYTPQTTLAGMIEKHTGAEPFDLPQFILDAAKNIDASQVPLDFLSNADTTGGNSGSPVVNGRGELVGLNFDRVWENVANDFGYNPAIARNISVDLRFLMWLLDLQKADSLRNELFGLRTQTGAVQVAQ
jgi:hypothetical protein